MKTKTDMKVRYICEGGLIAALYIAFTELASIMGIASGVIQVRISEALCVLLFFTPAAIPGLAVGCLVANLITDCIIQDVIFGTLATLIGAFGAWLLGLAAKKGFGFCKWLVPIPTIISNTLIMPFVLCYAYMFEGTIPFFMLTIGIGELISAGVLGILLLISLNKYSLFIFGHK